MGYFIGVDVGGTTCTICVGNAEREILYVSNQFPTLAAEGPPAVIQAIVEQAVAGIEQSGASLEKVMTVGLATPGPATLDGVLLKTPNFDPQLWNHVPIRSELERAFQEQSPGLSVRYLGDGQAAALGEYAIRNGIVSWSRLAAGDFHVKAVPSLFMAVVGTGLGGGAVQEGTVLRGSEGRAGHVGHILLPAFAFRYEHDRRLRVGNAYCTAESAISLTGLTHQLQYRLSLESWKGHSLHEVPGSMRAKAKRLRELAAAGDALALELFDDQARALGMTLLNVNYLGDYHLLVIGGGICDLPPDVRERYRHCAEAAYREHALEGFQNLSRFEFSVCGDDAPVIGALAWAYAAAP